MKRKLIADWMAHVIDTNAEYDDLHIDRVDRKWKDPLFWIDAGIKVFSEAIRLRSTYNYAVTIALVFSLKGGPKKIGVNFTDRKQLNENLGYIPPSLYLFKGGKEPWNSFRNENDLFEYDFAQGLEGIDFPAEIKRIFYFEFKPIAEEDYSRTLCVQA